MVLVDVRFALGVHVCSRRAESNIVLSKSLCVESDGGEADVLTFIDLVIVNKYASCAHSGDILSLIVLACLLPGWYSRALDTNQSLYQD